jgi:hypothetical protein
MLKLQVSVSRMMSRRAAAIRSESSRSDKDGRRCNFESGAAKELSGCHKLLADEKFVDVNVVIGMKQAA